MAADSEAEHDTVYGYDSQSGQLMTSTDRHNWDSKATFGVFERL